MTDNNVVAGFRFNDYLFYRGGPNGSVRAEYAGFAALRLDVDKAIAKCVKAIHTAENDT